MKIKELREYIFQLDDLLPVLIKHLQISDPHKLYGIKISLKQYLALDILAQKGKCMVSELSRNLGVALSTMTELTNRLVKKRFVKRRKDIKDNRIVWVNLTGKGLEIIQKINEKKQKHILSILEKLGEGERQALVNVLKVVSQAVKKVEIDRTAV